MYLRIADEEDRRRIEVLKGDTDQVLIFVSPCIELPTCDIVGQLVNYSVVYSPQLSQHWPWYQCRIFDQTH